MFGLLIVLVYLRLLFVYIFAGACLVIGYVYYALRFAFVGMFICCVFVFVCVLILYSV